MEKVFNNKLSLYIKVTQRSFRDSEFSSVPHTAHTQNIRHTLPVPLALTVTVSLAVSLCSDSDATR